MNPQKLQFQFAVLSVVTDLFGKNFSAYDVTLALRGKVNNGEIELVDAQREDVDGVNTYRIERDKVREIVSQLYTADLLPQYKRDYARAGGNTYRVYVYDANLPVNPTPVSTPQVLPTSSVPAQLPAKVGPVALTPQNQADIEAKILAYVKNQSALNSLPTLKKIQSRLKGIAVTCGELEGIVKRLGLVVTHNNSVQSRSTVGLY